MTTDDELTPLEKGAVVGWWLAQGEELTTTRLIMDFGISRAGARYILESASRVLPIESIKGPTQNHPHGWRRFNHT